jgi:hypothetical protein
MGETIPFDENKGQYAKRPVILGHLRQKDESTAEAAHEKNKRHRQLCHGSYPLNTQN